jgi:flagellar basal body-associated protein FliL
MSGEESGWTKGKIALVVVIICVVLAGVAVGGVLVFGKKKSSGTVVTTSSKTPTPQEIIKSYDQISKDAAAALAAMAKVSQQQALSSTPTQTSSSGTVSTTSDYQQDLDQVNEMFTQLEQDTSEALAAVTTAASVSSSAVTSAAGAATQTAQDYQQLYAQISAYYTYLEQLTQQAVAQVQYMQSLIPSFQEMEQYQNLMTRIQAAPPAVQKQLSGQLAQRAQAAIAKLNAGPAPQSLAPYIAGLNSLAQTMSGLTGQVQQAVSGGNQQGIAALSAQLNATIASAQKSVTEGLAGMANGLSTQLKDQVDTVDASVNRVKTQ